MIYYLHIDNMEFMRNCRDKQFKIGIVDPPYGLNANKMNMGAGNKRKDCSISDSTAQRIKKGRLNQGSGKLKNRLLNTSDSDWDNEPPPPEYFEELFRITEHQIIWGGNYFKLPPTRCFIVWDKMQPWENFSASEYAWTSFDMPSKLYRIRNTGGNNNFPKIHETQKPPALYDRIYQDFVETGWDVFDSHLGSGTNGLVAAKRGHDFTGCEISEEKYIAATRLLSQYRDTPLFENLIQTQIFQ